MKIKDILRLRFEKDQDQKKMMSIAYRVYSCSDTIKDAIRKLHEEKILPQIVLGIGYPDGNGHMSISSCDLVNKFGMDNLSALFFLDDLYKADQKEDKEDLLKLLGMLLNGKHCSNLPLNEELREYVQQNSPKVWEIYQGLVSDKASKDEARKMEYDKIKENEI